MWRNKELELELDSSYSTYSKHTGQIIYQIERQIKPQLTGLSVNQHYNKSKCVLNCRYWYLVYDILLVLGVHE